MTGSRRAHSQIFETSHHSVISLPTKKSGVSLSFMLTLPTPPLIGKNISGKKMFLAFRQILTKISPAACIFRSTITILLKKLVGIKSISSMQNSTQQDQKSNMSKTVPPPSELLWGTLGCVKLSKWLQSDSNPQVLSS